MSGEPGSGTLVVVGTPIGNLGDLSPRAVEALASAAVLYCEDTRRTRALLTHAGIRGATLRSLHEHNEAARVEAVLDALGDGRTIALVSDAGMPGLSDPGARVVAAAAGAGFAVSVVPGPSAVTAALAASGMDADRVSASKGSCRVRVPPGEPHWPRSPVSEGPPSSSKRRAGWPRPSTTSPRPAERTAEW